MPTWLESLKKHFSMTQLRESRFLIPFFEWHDALPDDQKNIVKISAIGLSLFSILFMLYLGSSKIGSLREEIIAKQQILKELSSAEEDLHMQQSLVKELEGKARALNADFSLLPTLESYAQSSGIGRESIESISPKQLPPGKYFVETEATVQLVHVTLKQLTIYFYKIETAKNNLAIKEVRIKPRFDDPQYLNIAFKVSAFKPKES